MIKYHYAYDENHNIVNIRALDKDITKKHFYFCVGCGQRLFPKMGEIKTHHFAHKKDVDCNGESYLHKLAKIKLKEKFDNKKTPFNVQMRRSLICKDKDVCSFYEEGKCCKYSLLKEIDLHKYYDTCTEEQTIYVDNSELKPVISFESKDGQEKYIADLLINDSNSKDKESVLIEIYCSHKCEVKKTNSKLKIIEIHISSDEDVDKWVTNTIVEDDDEYNELKTKEVKFINFNPKIQSQEILGSGRITRFVYFNNGSSYVPNYEEQLTCNMLHVKCKPYSEIELNIPCSYLSNPSPFEYGLVYLLGKGYKIKNCKLCKYCRGYEDSLASVPICCLYKKCGTPSSPKQSDAMNCQYYSLCTTLIEKIKTNLVDMKISEV